MIKKKMSTRELFDAIVDIAGFPRDSTAHEFCKDLHERIDALEQEHQVWNDIVERIKTYWERGDGLKDHHIRITLDFSESQVLIHCHNKVEKLTK